MIALCMVACTILLFSVLWGMYIKEFVEQSKQLVKSLAYVTPFTYGPLTIVGVELQGLTQIVNNTWCLERGQTYTRCDLYNPITPCSYNGFNVYGMEQVFRV